MSANTTKGFRGYGIAKKAGGAGAWVLGTEVNFPAIRYVPRNPLNNQYLPMVNKTSHPSIVVIGKRTPSLTVHTAMKASFCTVANLNSLIFSTDSNGDSDEFAWLVNNGAASRKFDGCRCAAMSISANAGGGPVGFELGFLAKTAEGATSFSGAGATDAGQLVNAAQIDFGSSPTASLVKAWRLNVIRGQAYDFFFNGTYYPADTSSGMLGGTFQIEVSAASATVPSSSATIRLFTGVPESLVLHSTWTLLLNLDEDVEDVDTGFGTLIKTYTLIDTSAGGAPVSIA